MKALKYGICQGFKNVVQNKIFSLAAIGTIATCLFLLGIFYALISNFQNMVHHAESSVGITVFFEEGISQRQIDEIGDEIQELKDVKEIRFISAQEAWEKFQDEMYEGSEDLEDTFGAENPLEDSASYEVYLKDVSQQSRLINYIEGIEGVRKVNGSNTVAKGLSSFNMLVAYISATIIILLLLVSLFLISTAVSTGIRVRRDEIGIMKMIGATDAFIKTPFLVEGVVIGLAGAAIPLVILWALYERVISFVLGHFSVLSQWLTFVEPAKEFAVLTPMSLLIGVGIGFVGSATSVHRHLHR